MSKLSINAHQSTQPKKAAGHNQYPKFSLLVATASNLSSPAVQVATAMPSAYLPPRPGFHPITVVGVIPCLAVEKRLVLGVPGGEALLARLCTLLVLLYTHLAIVNYVSFSCFCSQLFTTIVGIFIALVGSSGGSEHTIRIICSLQFPSPWL